MPSVREHHSEAMDDEMKWNTAPPTCNGTAKKRHRASLAGNVLSKKRMIVIGAGFAGLSAARTIQGACGDRVEVIVLEAGTNVGGRARSGKLPSGTPVELGATWFHGICGNPLYEIAVWEGLVRDLRGDPGLRKHEINWKVDFARPQCPDLLNGHFKEVAEEALDSYQEGAMELSGEHPAAETSVGAFLRRRFDEAVLSSGFTQEELGVFAESWLFREKQQRAFDGFFSSDDVSSTFPWEFETLEGPNMPVPGGFQAIAQSLADPLDVRFSHTVTNIEYGSGGVSVSCSNGVELEADAVLVTTSVGVLQAQHKTLFQPPLPDWKAAAIGSVRLGVADKIFLEWDLEDDVAGMQCTPEDRASSGTPSSSAPVASRSSELTGHDEPWNMGRRGLSVDDALVSASVQVPAAAASRGIAQRSSSAGSAEALMGGRKRRRQRKEIRTYALLWPVPEPLTLGTSGAAEAEASLPGGLSHWPPAGPSGRDAEGQLSLPAWLSGLHSIRFDPGPDWIEASEQEQFRAAQLPGPGPPPAEQQPRPKTASAVLWITGDAALEMEKLSDQEVQQGIGQLLATFPSIPLPPGAKMPPRVVRSRWGLDDCFRGSYSYTRAGVEDGEVVDIIAQPLTSDDGMPVVMFAGEATHRQYMGTVHGAYMSGYREAQRFMAALDKQEALLAWGLAVAAASGGESVVM